jgi:hypothetical protein
MFEQRVRTMLSGTVLIAAVATNLMVPAVAGPDAARVDLGVAQTVGHYALVPFPSEPADATAFVGRNRFGPTIQIAQRRKKDDDAVFQEAEEAHEKLFNEKRYPSAATCGTCHPKHYKEWSVSQHAYAQLSPVYMAINNFLNFSTSGSMGDFCLRCHN